MKLSKPGLVFLVLYLLWAGYWYSGYLTCPPGRKVGTAWMPIFDPCAIDLSLVTFPVGWVFAWIFPKAIPNTEAARHLSILVFFFISCAVFYALGAGIGWLARRNNPSVQP